MSIYRRRSTASWCTSFPLRPFYVLCLPSGLHSEKGVDVHALKEQMLELLQQRGAQYPAEHNVGHLYKAPETLQKFYRENDPTNSMNPGIGKTSKRKNWQGSGVKLRDGRVSPSEFTLIVLSAVCPRRRHFGGFCFYSSTLLRHRHHFTGFNPVRRRLASAKWVYLPNASITTSATGLLLITVRITRQWPAALVKPVLVN